MASPMMQQFEAAKARCPGALVLFRMGDFYELFGDDVRFLGALATDSGLRLLIHQPAISGTPATDDEIERFFTTSGWLRFIIEGNIAYFDPDRRVVISDTHRGNIILMDDGLLAPIDLRVQSVSGSLLDTVAKLCNSSSSDH
jgi:hypothetical protein